MQSDVLAVAQAPMHREVLRQHGGCAFFFCSAVAVVGVKLEETAAYDFAESSLGHEDQVLHQGPRPDRHQYQTAYY